MEVRARPLLLRGKGAKLHGEIVSKQTEEIQFFFLKDYLAKELIGDMAISTPITPYNPFG